MVSRFQYYAFGQVIASDFEIDVLAAAPPEKIPTLKVQLATGLRRRKLSDDPFFEISAERQFFEWSAVGAFEITNPNCIRVDPGPDVSLSLVSQPLLGIVISVALERLGLFCLHGGCVNVDGGAVIVLGDKGAGKSTTVSSLLRAGHRLLTDDLVALDCGDYSGAAEVKCGFPAVKLWPDSADALAVDTTVGSTLIHPSITKFQKRIDPKTMSEDVPTSAIFLLSQVQDGSTHAERISGAKALEALLYFAFIARFGNTSLGKVHLAQFMKRCCYIIKTTPVYILHIRRDLERLDDLVSVIRRTAVETKNM